MLDPLRKALTFLTCIALVLALAGNAVLLVGCGGDTQDEVQDVGEEAGEAAESAGEDVQEGAEDAAEETGEAMEDLGEDMQ